MSAGGSGSSVVSNTESTSGSVVLASPENSILVVTAAVTAPDHPGRAAFYRCSQIEKKMAV